MEFFKNFIVNLHATGPAAVIIVWIICITLLGIYGTGEHVKSVINILALVGGMILIGLAQRT